MAGSLKTVHAILSPYANIPALVHVQVWVHIPGDPQSVQLRNATTTTMVVTAMMMLVMMMTVVMMVMIMGHLCYYSAIHLRF